MTDWFEIAKGIVREHHQKMGYPPVHQHPLAKAMDGATLTIIQRGGFTGMANDNHEYFWDVSRDGKRMTLECASYEAAYKFTDAHYRDHSDEQEPLFEVVFHKFYYKDDGETVDVETRRAWI